MLVFFCYTQQCADEETNWDAFSKLGLNSFYVITRTGMEGEISRILKYCPDHKVYDKTCGSKKVDLKQAEIVGLYSSHNASNKVRLLSF